MTLHVLYICLHTPTETDETLFYRTDQGFSNFLVCDPILEKKFLRDSRVGSLHVNDI